MFLPTKLVIKYANFAIIATAINIGTQDLTTRFYSGPFAIPLSVGLGTGVGLLAKYMLDKRYIFFFKTKNIAHNTQTFVLYVAMGLITTLIFWFFEFGFQYIFGTKEMRYLGGIIGLGLGYLAKYHLDKKYVFFA